MNVCANRAKIARGESEFSIWFSSLLSFDVLSMENNNDSVCLWVYSTFIFDIPWMEYIDLVCLWLSCTKYMFSFHGAQSRTHRMNWTHSALIFMGIIIAYDNNVRSVYTRIDLLKLQNWICFHFFLFVFIFSILNSFILSCNAVNDVYSFNEGKTKKMIKPISSFENCTSMDLWWYFNISHMKMTFVIILRWEIGAIILHFCLDSSFLCVLFSFHIFLYLLFARWLTPFTLPHLAMVLLFLSWSRRVSNVFDPECWKQIIPQLPYPVINKKNTQTHTCIFIIT